VSDFLKNLALRSLGSAKVVRPRLPALFEQAQPAAGALFAPGAAMSEKGREQLKEILAERDSDAASASGRASHVSTAELIPAKRRGDESSAQEHPITAPLEPAALLPMARLQIPASAPSSSSVPGSSGTHSPSPLLEPQSDEAERFAIRLSRAGKDAAGSKPHLQDSDPASGGLAEPRLQPPEKKPRLPFSPAQIKPQAEHAGAPYSAAADLPASLRRIIESRLAPHTQKPAPAATSRQGNLSEPTIQVTIGRIEVRAAQQPASAAKGRATSPVMSLDEYLRRRSQRGGQ